MKKLWAVLLALTLALLLVGGCSSSSHASSSSQTSTEWAGESAADSMEAPAAESQPLVDAVEPARKLVRSGQIEMQTKDFDATLSGVEQLTATLKGYAEQSSVSGSGLDADYGTRSAQFVLRIPSEHFTQAVSDFSALGVVVSSSTSAEDVTDQYYDTQSELDSLRIQQERLLAMMEQTTEMSDLIALEEELTQVRARINERTSTLKHYDGLVDYATLTLNIEEVREYVAPAEPTFGSRIAETFAGSMDFVRSFGQGVVLVFVAVAPFVVIYGGLVLIVVLVIVFLVRNARKHRQNKEKKA